MQQTGQVRRLGVGSGALGQRARDSGHLAGVHVQQSARGAARARCELEEAAHGSLEGEAPDAHAADEVDGLADGLGAHGARARGGVGEAQDVGRQPGIGLERGDELARVGLGIARELADASQRAIEHRQLADALDGILQLRVDGRGMWGRGEHRPGPNRRQKGPGVERTSAPADRGPVLESAGGRAQRCDGATDAGAPVPLGGLWAEPRFVSLTLGVTIVFFLTNTTVGRMCRGAHHPSVR